MSAPELGTVPPYQSAEFRQFPYPFYEAARSEAPVYHVPETDDYLITRYDDLTWVASHPELFSNHKQWVTAERPALQAIAAQQKYPTMPVVVDEDPPLHGLYRDIAFRAFTPRRLRGYEPMIRTVVDELIDSFAPSGRVELVSEFANRMPMAVIVQILGLPRGMMPAFKRWSDEWAELSSRYLTEERAEHCQRSAVDFNDYLADQIAMRRENPSDDVISELAQARGPDGEPLGMAELVNIVRLLLIAGNETTAFLLANTVALLLRDPDQLATVLSQRALLKRAVEESLRVESPTQWSWRKVIADVELGGMTIPAGSRVLLAWASGNRDTARFDQPDDFSCTRSNVKDHLAFGHGIHFCLGASLARLEGEIAIGRLFERLPNLRFASDGELDHIDSAIFRSVRQLKLAFDPAAQWA